MNKRRKTSILFFGILGVFILWFIILYYISPSQIIAKFGATDSYAVLFLMSVIGGSSVVTASSYYLTVSVLALGGLNYFLIGVVGGVGVSIGDSIYYYLGFRGRDISSEKFKSRITKIDSFLKRFPEWAIPIFIYFYSFTPFVSNDLMVTFMGLIEYPYKKTIVPLILGNITGTTILAFVAPLGLKIVGIL